MMNHDMLQDVDYLREKADVSYEEAMHLLERYNGNVMQAMVELEKKGRLFSQEPSAYQQAEQEPWQSCAKDRRSKASSFLRKAQKTRVLIERKRADGGKETVLNICAPLVAGAILFAPYITLAAVGVGFFSGYNARVEFPNENV